MSLELAAWGDRRQSHYGVPIEQKQNDLTLLLFHNDTMGKNHTWEGGCRGVKGWIDGMNVKGEGLGGGSDGSDTNSFLPGN